MWGRHTPVRLDQSEKYSRQGVCKSRGRTFIAGPGFLFCAPVNGVDYKSPKKRTMANQAGERMRAVRHDAGDNNQVKRDDLKQCQFLDEYLQTNFNPNLAAEKFLRQIRAAKYVVQTRRSSSRCEVA